LSFANVEPRPAFYRYLKAIVEAGYGERELRNIRIETEYAD